MRIGQILSATALIMAVMLSTPITAFGQRECGPTANVACPSGPSSDPTPQVCFYTQPDFGGRFFCESGLRRVNQVDEKWRDLIKSVQVINSASVLICEEFNRDGECLLIEKDRPELPPNLYDHLYSYKIKE